MRQTCCHNCDANLVAQRLIISRAINHMGFRRCKSANGIHGFAGLGQFQTTFGCRDEHQYTLGTGHINTFKQRASHGLLSGNACAVWSVGCGCSHHRFALLAHDGTNVFKVNVHQCFHIDDLGYSAYRVTQHVIGISKSLVLGDVVAQHIQQFFIQHHNQRVHVCL